MGAFGLMTYPPDPLPLIIGEGKGVNFREGLAPLSDSPYFFLRYLRYNSSREIFRIRDKTAGIASIHKFSSMLMPRRTQAPRTTKVNTIPTAAQPTARNMYSLTIVRIIIGYGLKQHKSAHIRGTFRAFGLMTYPPDPLPFGDW